MSKNRGKLVSRMSGDGMLNSEEAGQVFALRKLGWGMKRISSELGIARNTVKAWLKAGPERCYGGPNRISGLDAHRDWIRERWRVGVRNGDVFRQELLAKGVQVSLRTVERALCSLRREQVVTDKATLRFETPPGKQMQIDFGEKWLTIGQVPQKRFVFVATLGHSRREYAEICFGLRQRDWILGIEHAFAYFGGVPEELLVIHFKERTRVNSHKGIAPPLFASLHAFQKKSILPVHKTLQHRDRSLGVCKDLLIHRHDIIASRQSGIICFIWEHNVSMYRNNAPESQWEKKKLQGSFIEATRPGKF